MRALLLILFFVLAMSSAEQRPERLQFKRGIEKRASVSVVQKIMNKGVDTGSKDNGQENSSTPESNLFSWADYTVLGAMLIISCLIGTFYGCFSKKHESSDDFLLGGSDMGTLPMAMSLAASFITAIELLGNPAEMYSQGTQFWMSCLAFILVVPITSRLYLPVYMKLRLTSSYEYLNLRFNHHCRLFASMLYMLQMILYTSVAVYAPAVALSHVTGLNTYVAVSLVYLVCIFYASQGGMKAVIMTDTFQAAVLMGSLLLIYIWGTIMAGGQYSVWKDAEAGNRLEFFNKDPSPTVRHSFWSVVIGGTFYWTTMFCSNQASIQKYLSVESISQVRKALVISSVGLIIIYTLNFLIGAVLYSAYKYCDPVISTKIDDYDQLLPLYVMEFMGKAHGVPGFFVAGIFAASLGTVASAMNSLSAITCEDLLQGLFKIDIPASKGAAYAKWISVFFGVLSFALVFIVKDLGSVLQVALSFNGMVGGVTLGLFSLGMFIPWANAKGAISGALISLIVVMWMGIGALHSDIVLEKKPISIRDCPAANATILEVHHEDVSSFYKISYLWYSAIGCLGTMIIGVIVSYVTGFQDPADLDHDLLSPPIRRLFDNSEKKPVKVQTSTLNQNLGVANLALEMDDEKPRMVVNNNVNFDKPAVIETIIIEKPLKK